jgi:hypothetical protein
MSQAWRRLAHKTSALGLLGTLAVFLGAVFVVSTPGVASAAVTKQFTYTCGTGGPYNNPSITVGLSAPDSVTAGQTFDLTVNLPALTLTTAPQAATTVQATMALTPTGGTVSDAGAKAGPAVTASTTAVPAGSVVYKIAVTAGTTSKVSVKPGELKLALTSATTPVTTCTTTSTDVLDVPIGTGGGTGGDDVVAYTCVAGTAGAEDAVDIKVVMTPPTSATTNVDASITWTGTIQSTGDPLTAPVGFPTTSPKMFVTVKATGGGAPATATGEGTLTGVTAGSDILTLPTVTVKIKPTTAGTVSLTAGDISFGTSSTSPSIKCTAPATGLKAYTFTVTAGTASPTATTTSSTPKPTNTKTATITITPTSTKKTSQTPKAGADTGAGGEMGPDGRLFILTGGALIGAAAVGGLVIRRRSIKG